MKICPNCGWENQDDFNFCLGCGSQLPSDTKAEEASPEPVPVPAKSEAEPEVMVSTVEDSPKSAQVLEELVEAAPVAEEPKERDCPTCGSVVPPGHIFCGQCGSKLEIEPVVTQGPPLEEKIKEPEVPESIARLVLLLPNGEEGGTYPLKSSSTKIGRSQGNILFLDDPYVSPLHATFEQEDSNFRVKNEGSYNGFFIRLRERRVLNHGDVVLMGKQLLRFEKLSISSHLQEEALSGNTVPPVWGSPYGSYWGRLVQLVAGAFEGNAILLGGSQVELGRERGQITFPGDRFISSIHSRISKVDDQFYVEDVGSRNGTFVQVRGEYPLSHKDILIIGEQLLRFEVNS